MIYTEQIVRETLARGETFSVECKLARREIPGTFWESFSAFANSDGGVIFLGVREENHEFTVEGIEDARKIVTDFWNMVHSPNKVSAEVVFERNVQIVNCGGKNIVVVEVPRAERQDRPVYVGEDVFRGTFRRNGEGDYRCSREAVKAMIRDQGEITADACMLEKRAVTDLNADTLRRYRTLFANLHPDHVWNRLPDDEFLMKIGAAKRGGDHKVHPTVAGLVCFADFNTIMDELPNFFLDYREHLSAGVRWTDRICSGDATWSGNVFDFFFRISQSITAGVKVPFKIASDNVTRDDDTPVHKSIREVLAMPLFMPITTADRALSSKNTSRSSLFQIRVPCASASQWQSPEVRAMPAMPRSSTFSHLSKLASVPVSDCRSFTEHGSRLDMQSLFSRSPSILTA